MKPSIGNFWEPFALSEYPSKIIVIFFQQYKFCLFSFLSSAACFRNPILKMINFRKKRIFPSAGVKVGTVLNYSKNYSSFKTNKKTDKCKILNSLSILWTRGLKWSRKITPKYFMDISTISRICLFKGTVNTISSNTTIIKYVSQQKTFFYNS